MKDQSKFEISLLFNQFLKEINAFIIMQKNIKTLTFLFYITRKDLN